MLRSVLIILALVLVTAFAAANWPAFTAATPLTLGFVDFTAPLGLLMLAVLAAVTLLLLGSLALWQMSMLAESRRNAKALEAQRALVEDAEASRVTELRTVLLGEVSRLDQRIETTHATLRGELLDGVNSIAAMIAEIDDRLQRELGPPPPPPGAPIVQPVPPIRRH